MKSSKPTKPCKRCDIGRAKLDERFCPRCREIVRKEMQVSYLTPDAARQPSETRGRSQRLLRSRKTAGTSARRESTTKTKFQNNSKKAQGSHGDEKNVS